MAVKQDILKIVITGPESSGKTVLAKSLAEALNVPWAPEFARFYLAHLGRPYEHKDLKTIGAGQRHWENWYALNFPETADKPVLLCDTDWTVLQVWEQYRFRPDGAFEWEKGYGFASNADLYLLCAPDFPWQHDPLREHPEERDILFSMYLTLLQKRNAGFMILSGEHEARLQAALTEINKLF